MTDKMIEVPEIEYSVLRKFADDKRCNFKELCDAVREAVEAPLRLRAELLRAPAKEAVTPANMVPVDRGALKMAENVLRRAGKDEVADALMQSCGRPAARCHICNGNDADIPCAYTTERPDGCPRVARLAAHTDNEGEPLPKSICCRACSTAWERMTTFIVCKTCGNKRCPHAEDHRYACTGSNKPDQVPRFADGHGDGEVLALSDADFQEPITPAQLAKLMRENPDLRFTVGRKTDDLEAMRRDAVKRAARMAELNRMLREGGWHIESIREFRRELIALEDEALAAEKREG